MAYDTGDFQIRDYISQTTSNIASSHPKALLSSSGETHLSKIDVFYLHINKRLAWFFQIDTTTETNDSAHGYLLYKSQQLNREIENKLTRIN